VGLSALDALLAAAAGSMLLVVDLCTNVSRSSIQRGAAAVHARLLTCAVLLSLSFSLSFSSAGAACAQRIALLLSRRAGVRLGEPSDVVSEWTAIALAQLGQSQSVQRCPTFRFFPSDKLSDSFSGADRRRSSVASH
jgi:hypothetical protein